MTTIQAASILISVPLAAWGALWAYSKFRDWSNWIDVKRVAKSAQAQWLASHPNDTEETIK